MRLRLSLCLTNAVVCNKAGTMCVLSGAVTSPSWLANGGLILHLPPGKSSYSRVAYLVD